MFDVNKNLSVQKFYINTSTKKFVPASDTQYDYQIFDVLLGSYNDLTYNAIVAVENTNIVIFYPTINEKEYFNVDGSLFSDIVLDVVAIKNNNLLENYAPFTFKGCIYKNMTGKYFMLQGLDTEEPIELTDGKNAHAYYQADGIINFYVCKNESVYRYKIKKDKNNNYYLSDDLHIYKGYSMITEVNLNKLLGEKSEVKEIVYKY